MREQITTPSSHISRRRLLAIAGGATAAATLGPSVIAATAQQNAEATPAATPSATPAAQTLPEFPIPSTLAADASPLFRTVTDALVTAMKASLVPGVAIGLLAGGREEHAAFGLASLSSSARSRQKRSFRSAQSRRRSPPQPSGT